MFKNNLIVSIKYITNFNPIFYKNLEKFNFINKNKIYCKNFFLFLFLLKYLNNLKFCKNIKLFIKPIKKFYYNILKAPYKNKLSKHQIGIFRYNINLKLIFFSKILILNTFKHIFLYLNKLKFFFFIIDSNFLYKHKLNLFLNIKCNYFFVKKK